MKRFLAATMLVAGLLVSIGGLAIFALSLLKGAWWTALWGLLAALAGVVVHFSGLVAAFWAAHGPRSPQEKDHGRRLRTFDRAIRAEKRRRRPALPHADWPTWWRAEITDIRASGMTAPESFITYVLAQRRDAGLQDFDSGIVD